MIRTVELAALLGHARPWLERGSELAEPASTDAVSAKVEADPRGARCAEERDREAQPVLAPRGLRTAKRLRQ